MKLSSLVLFFAVLATALHAQGAPPRSDLERAHRAQIEQRTARAAWPLGAVRAGLPTATELAGFASEVPVAEDGLLVRTYRSAAGDTPAFVLESRVADDALGAQETLIDWLAGVQSAARMPSAAEAGLAVGEAGFVGRSGARTGALAWIAFVRGNVAVRVTASDLAATPTLELGPVALALDRAVLGSLVLEPGRKPARPALERLEVAATAVAGARLPLTLAGVEQGAHLQWRVGGAGLGYVERGAGGGWELCTTGPGRMSVELDVIGALGTVTTRSVELTVADD
jgi:hypothetical protein